MRSILSRLVFSLCWVCLCSLYSRTKLASLWRYNCSGYHLNSWYIQQRFSTLAGESLNNSQKTSVSLETIQLPVPSLVNLLKFNIMQTCLSENSVGSLCTFLDLLCCVCSSPRNTAVWILGPIPWAGICLQDSEKPKLPHSPWDLLLVPPTEKNVLIVVLTEMISLLLRITEVSFLLPQVWRLSNSNLLSSFLVISSGR